MKAYIIGDMLSLWAQYEIEQIENILDKLSIDYYSARKNKDINDKATASNKNLAERIVAKDMAGIEDANLIIYNVNQNAIGSTTEIGAVMQWNRIYEKVDPKKMKKVITISSDIRRANKEIEEGDRRSWSVNAFLYGTILYLTNNKGILDFNQLEKALTDLLNNN